MTEDAIRAVVVEALEQGNVLAMRDKNLTQPFLEGREDVPLDDLDMDSLAVMEVCIAIEAHTGVEIVPDDLQRIATLRQLVQAVLEGLR